MGLSLSKGLMESLLPPEWWVHLRPMTWAPLPGCPPRFLSWPWAWSSSGRLRAPPWPGLCLTNPLGLSLGFPRQPHPAWAQGDPHCCESATAPRGYSQEAWGLDGWSVSPASLRGCHTYICVEDSVAQWGPWSHADQVGDGGAPALLQSPRPLECKRGRCCTPSRAPGNPAA